MRTEVGGMQPQAKGHLQPPEARRGQEASPLGTSEGARPCPHLDLGLQAFRTVRGYISVVLSHLVCGHLL